MSYEEALQAAGAEVLDPIDSGFFMPADFVAGVQANNQ